MTILPAHTQRLVRNRGMAALYGIEAEHDCDVSDVLDLLVTTSFTSISGPDKPFAPVLVTTPSQPGETSRSHAPAAQTDGAAEPPVPTEPSVDLSGLAAHEQGPSPELPSPGNAPEPESRSTRSRPSGSGDFLPKVGRPSLNARVLAVYEEHPDWTNGRIAAHVGCSHSTVSTWLAPRRREAKARIAEALKAPAKPQEAVEPPPAPQARPEPEQPPAIKSVTPRSVTAPNEPRRIVPTHAPVGAGPSTRFYVRDMKGRYLHQSLERSPTDNGPLMTSNRKWAWYDNAQRFAGACRKWPEIADMRKELPQP